MDLPHRDQFNSIVVANLPLCREHFRLILRVSQFPDTAPGQFIQIACRDMQRTYSADVELPWPPAAQQSTPLLSSPELAGPMAMLRRPFSLAGRLNTPAGVELHIIHRVVGVGTDWLAHLRAGDQVDLLGPLGNRFTPPPNDGIALLVGGGVGIPPMLYLAEQLAGRKAVAFAGALTRELLPFTITADAPVPSADAIHPLYNVLEFARHGVPALLTTDDGSYGFRGFVTQALERYLDEFILAQGPRAASGIVIYTCGPEPMMKRVAEIAQARGLACQIAVERAMACGMGTCQSCCIKVKKPDPTQPPLPGKTWCYRLACTDGPVFPASDLLW